MDLQSHLPVADSGFTKSSDNLLSCFPLHFTGLGLNRVEVFHLPGSKRQNLALTVLHLPHSLESGLPSTDPHPPFVHTTLPPQKPLRGGIPCSFLEPFVRF